MFQRCLVSLFALAVSLCSAAPVDSAASLLSRLPLHFEPVGASLLARVPAYSLMLDESGARFLLKTGELRLKFAGSRLAKAQPRERLAGVSNYIQGRDPKAWRLAVPHYGRARYEAIYPGIDLDFYGTARSLEYDFLVAPHADVTKIRMRMEGADSLELAASGDLALNARGGSVGLKAPAAWQMHGNRKVTVAVRFRLEHGSIGFELGDYDRNLPLVIDPVVTFASYLGGEDSDIATAIAVDSQSNILVTGYTASTRFPTNGTPLKSNFGGGPEDAFVVKIAAAGNQLLFSTYLGGTGSDRPVSIVVDGAGNSVVAGNSNSPDFPIAGNTFQGSGTGVFLARLSASGSELLASTFLGGIADLGIGFVSAMSSDPAGNLYLAGFTNANNFVTTTGALQPTKRSGNDGFLTKVSANLTTLLYSTYLGGDGADQINALTVDAQGRAYVTGSTASANFPVTAGAYTSANRGAADAFVTRINANGAAIDFSAIVGGSQDDYGTAIALGVGNSIYVAGLTLSNNFPTTPGVFQVLRPQFATSGFVAKLDPSGGTLVYGTYLGSASTYFDVRNVAGVQADSSDSLWIAGTGFGAGFPITAGAIQSAAPGFQDGVIAQLSPAGDILNYSSYLGGSADDVLNAMTFDNAGNMYLAGSTVSPNFPVTAGAFQIPFGGVRDAFVVKVNIGAVTTPCVYTLSIPSFTTDSNGGLGSVDLATDSTCAWNVTSSQPWLTLSGPPSGTGSTTIVFTVAANTTLANRSATLTIGTKTLTVSQLAAPCTYAIDPANRSVPSTGGALTFVVTTLAGCTYSAATNSPWLQLASSATANGTGQFHVNFDANPASIPRTGSLTIARQWVQLSQPAPVPVQAFDDVPLSNPFADHIFLMKYDGVADFCNGTPNTFCPDALTTRAQMSQYIIRGLSGGDNFTYTGTPYFTDVPQQHPYFPYVQKMRDLGITAGCTTTTYCPDDNVTRSQMAAFIIRARLKIRSGQTFPYSTAQAFTDVPSTDQFFSFVQKMKEFGITSGCSLTTYCPTDFTSRGQMAVFVIRALFTP